jgi:pseudaminic acid biosynthesis-associated methylase
VAYGTDEEQFWEGEFGAAYARRNTGPELLASNLAFFSKALGCASPPRTCIEFGANIGMNLRALQLLYPGQEQHAVEINPEASKELSTVVPPANVVQGSLLEFDANRTWELVLSKGLLIHVNPASLPKAYEALHRATGRYLLVCEYYNPAPVTIEYRGHRDRLYKRDFAGELLGRYADLRLRDYGFAYRRDPSFPQDDISWFLLEKSQTTSSGA